MRLRARILVITLTTLIAVAQLQHGLATLGLIWHEILSWDNPATHAFEDSALFAPPHDDPGRQVRDHIVGSAGNPSGRALPIEAPPCRRNLALSSPISRSPPAA